MRRRALSPPHRGTRPFAPSPPSPPFSGVFPPPHSEMEQRGEGGRMEVEALNRSVWLSSPALTCHSLSLRSPAPLFPSSSERAALRAPERRMLRRKQREAGNSCGKQVKTYTEASRKENRGANATEARPQQNKKAKQAQASRHKVIIAKDTQPSRKQKQKQTRSRLISHKCGDTVDTVEARRRGLVLGIAIRRAQPTHRQAIVRESH